MIISEVIRNNGKYGVMQLKEHIPELNDGGHRQKLIACVKNMIPIIANQL